MHGGNCWSIISLLPPALMANISYNQYRFPGEDDFSGAATALLRLQDTYKLSPSLISSGKLGSASAVSMTCEYHVTKNVQHVHWYVTVHMYMFYLIDEHVDIGNFITWITCTCIYIYMIFNPLSQFSWVWLFVYAITASTSVLYMYMYVYILKWCTCTLYICCSFSSCTCTHTHSWRLLSHRS